MKISEWGISNEISDMDNSYIRTTNIINLIFVSVIAIPLFIFSVFFTSDGFIGYSRFVLLFSFAFFNILLNTFRQYTLAKIFTLVIPMFCLIFYPILVTNKIEPGIFLWLPYGIMILGTVSFLIFSIEKERTKMFAMVGFFIIVIFGFDELMIVTFENDHDLSFVKDNYLFYVISKIVLTLVLYSAFFIFKFIYHKNRMDLHLLSEELNRKNNELRFLNSSLELKIEERTEKLKLQNRRIKKLASTNAHQVRARIARIIGLMEVSKYEITDEEKAFYEAKIIENVIELDNLTKTISKELIEED
jgi:hypothetical protein